MFKLFYTLLVIEYVVENQDVSTTVIFPSEYECYEAMGDGVMDNLYIMMYCKRTPFVSGYRDIIKPKVRPDG